jgi:hypothetical protein
LFGGGLLLPVSSVVLSIMLLSAKVDTTPAAPRWIAWSPRSSQ